MVTRLVMASGSQGGATRIPVESVPIPLFPVNPPSLFCVSTQAAGSPACFRPGQGRVPSSGLGSEPRPAGPAPLSTGRGRPGVGGSRGWGLGLRRAERAWRLETQMSIVKRALGRRQARGSLSPEPSPKPHVWMTGAHLKASHGPTDCSPFFLCEGPLP